LVEPLACVVKALKRARFAPGMRVLVIGLGFIGQLFGFLLRRRGAGRLAGSDAVSRRLALAREHWADEVYDVSRPPAAPRLTSAVPEQAFDLVVVTPGSPKAMLEGIKYVRSGGTLLLFAPAAPGETVPFPVEELFFREVNIVTSYSAGPDDMKEALEHVVSGHDPADVLITHRFPLHQAEAAYRTARDVHTSLQVVVTMDCPAPAAQRDARTKRRASVRKRDHRDFRPSSTGPMAGPLDAFTQIGPATRPPSGPTDPTLEQFLLRRATYRSNGCTSARRTLKGV